MADLTDPQRYGPKLNNQLELLEEANISEADRGAIHAFVRHLSAEDDVGKGTIVGRLNKLRLSSERADMAITVMGRDDVDEFLFEMEREHDLSEGSMRNYRKALRTFYQYRDVKWADDIRIGASPDRPVDPNNLLTMDEISDLLDAATNPRDTAVIALLADSGLRIGAVASLRVRDVDFSGKAALVTVNDNANVKDASGTTPLTWAEGYVANWLQAHPRPDESEAPLIHVRRGWYDSDEDGDGSLDYQYLSRRIRDIADEAGIDRSRVNTHNFRKSAISRWIREGMSDQEIKHRAHWDVDTDQFSQYSGVRDEELNDQILQHYGFEPDEPRRPQLDQCPRCGAALTGDESFCMSCGGPLTDEAAAASDDIDDEIFDSVAVASELSNVELLSAFRDRFEDDTEFRKLLLGSDHDESSS